MKVMTHSLYPISLQGKRFAGDLFNVSSLDDRYFLIDGQKVSRKYFTEPFEVLEKGENVNSPYLRSCIRCGIKGQKCYPINYEYICINCADGVLHTCSICNAKTSKIKEIDNYKVCNNCNSYFSRCIGCNNITDNRITGNTSCKRCTQVCGVCSVVSRNKYCSYHSISTVDSSTIDFPSNRATAMEVEVVGQNSLYLDKWRNVQDTSLTKGGTEYISYPYSGDQYLLRDVECLENACEKNSCYADHSCGLHVHVDTRDFTEEELMRLYLLCKNIEPWIYSVVIPSRKESKYCEPLNFKEASTVEDTIYGEYLTNKIFVKRDKYQVPRYKWVNFHSHFYRGSIEFRCHHGTTSSEKIYNWALLCNSIVHYAKTKEDIPSDGIDILTKLNIKRKFINYFKKRREVMQ